MMASTENQEVLTEANEEVQTQPQLEHVQEEVISQDIPTIEQTSSEQTTNEQNSTVSEGNTENLQDGQQQTLYVAIQPGASMDPNHVEQPAVYVEVVEAGSGTEISSGTEQIVQSEMVIDHANTTEVTTIPSSVLSQVIDQAALSTMQAEMIAVQVLSQSASGDIQCLQQQNPAQFIPIASTESTTLNNLQATLGQLPFATLQINSTSGGTGTTQTIQLPGGQTIQVPISQTLQVSTAATSGEATAAPTALTTTNTEAIMSAGLADSGTTADEITQVEAVLNTVAQQQNNGSQSNSIAAQLQEVAASAEAEDGDDSKPKYTCDLCGKSYIRSWSYYGHMREHASGDKQHKCDVCNKVFNYASNLRQHMLIHTGEKPYECEFCEKAFNNPSSLRSHVLSHSVDRPYVCEHAGCDKAFNNPGSLRVHRRVHQEDKPHKCTFEGCDKAFKTPAELSRHAFRHSGEKPHKCDQCEKSFIRYDDLKRHYRIHTGEKPFKCDQCDFACIQSFDLVKHKFTHSGDKPYKCNICPKQFTRPARLRDHMRTHTGEKPYVCDVCGKGFAIQTGLKSHQAVHTGDKPFKCDDCDKTFRTQVELQSHTGRHTGIKPFKCDLCDKEFISAITFKRHAIVHSGEKPYECDQCGRRFARSTDLKVHMPVHSDDKPYKCGECEKMFTRFSTLKEHIRTHTGERPFKCDACGREFNHRSHFNNHLRIHTGVKPFKCEICDKDFSRKASLRYHMKVHTKTGGRTRAPRSKRQDNGSESDIMDGSEQDVSHEVTTVAQGLADHTSTVNISQLGSEAEVQLAEALVAVSEGLAAVNEDEGVNAPHVVAVEETTSSAMTSEAVIQQVHDAATVLSQVAEGHAITTQVVIDPVTQAAVNAGISAEDVVQTVVTQSDLSAALHDHHQMVEIPVSAHQGHVTEVTVSQPQLSGVTISEISQGHLTLGHDAENVHAITAEPMETDAPVTQVMGVVDQNKAVTVTVTAEILAAMAEASQAQMLVAVAQAQAQAQAEAHAQPGEEGQSIEAAVQEVHTEQETMEIQ